MSIFDDFIKETGVPCEIVKKYSGILPEELIDVWQKYGFGSIINGYLKIINPEEYTDILKNSYFRADVAVPIFVTGFGDIVTWEENEYVCIIRYRRGTFDIILKKFKFFFGNMVDEEFLKMYFDIQKYNEAVTKYGNIKFDECFGYVPLLGLGGSEKVDNLKVVKTREHIELITQLVGRIE